MAETEELFLRRTIADLERRLLLVGSGASVNPSAPTAPAVPTAPAAPTAPVALPQPVSPIATPPPPPTNAPTSFPTIPAPAAAAAAFNADPSFSSPPPPAPHAQQRPISPVNPWQAPSAETLLKWAGLLLVFLAAVFMVSTAIDRGWIGPELQLAGSFAIGGVLVAGGLYLREKRPDWGPPLAGVGTTVLSVCAIAGWQWLELGVAGVWLGVGVGVHALALWLSHRFDGPGVAAASTIAATTSVIWIAEGSPGSAVLTTLIALSSMALSVTLRRPSLHVWASGTAIAAFGILATTANLDFPDTAWITLVAGIIAAVAMWFMPIAFDVMTPPKSAANESWIAFARRLPLSLPPLVATAIVLSINSENLNEGLIYLFCGGIALALAGGLYSLVQRATVRCDQAVWITQTLGGLAAIAIGTALVFDGPAFLASLIVQSAALLVFIRFVDDKFALAQAGLVTAIAAVFGGGRMLYGIDVELDWIDHLVHLALVAVIGGWALVEPQRVLRRPLAIVAYATAVLWAVPTFIHFDQGQAAISSVWALLGLAALVAGSIRSSSLAIQGGLATLAIVVLKLLTIDLVDVDTFWRVGLFFLLGGAFLAVSFKFGAGLGRISEPVVDEAAVGSTDGQPSAPTPPAPPQRPPTAD